MTPIRDHSLGSHWTSIDAVIAAARARHVYLMVWNPGTLDEHREVLVALSPDNVVAIRLSREEQGGWIAARLAPDGTDIPDTLRSLARAGASGSQILDAVINAETSSTA